MNILHVVSHLGYAGFNTELFPLVRDQTSLGHDVRVCCGSRRGPWANRLEALGADVVTLNWSKPFDIAPPWRLRDELTRPSVEAIHVWGVPMLRWVGLLTPSLLPHAILTAPLGQASAVDRWLLSRVGRVIARDQAEREEFLSRGAKNVSVVPLGVDVTAASPAPNQKGIAAVGPVEKSKNFRDAVWTLDILNQVFPDATLTIVGNGSQFPVVERFASQLNNPQLTFAGECDDAGAMLESADICWLTGTSGCRHAALEAMAAGRALIASDLPHLRELIHDGETGLLVRPRDKIALARATRTLLRDPDLRQRIGDAARRQIAEKYSLPAFTNRWRDLHRAA